MPYAPGLDAERLDGRPPPASLRARELGRCHSVPHRHLQPTLPRSAIAGSISVHSSASAKGPEGNRARGVSSHPAASHEKPRDRERCRSQPRSALPHPANSRTRLLLDTPSAICRYGLADNCHDGYQRQSVTLTCLSPNNHVSFLGVHSNLLPPLLLLSLYDEGHDEDDRIVIFRFGVSAIGRKREHST